MTPPIPTTEMIQRWPTEKVLVSEKNTRQPKAKDCQELILSIKTTGQSTPAIARPHPTKEGFLELAAGARRRTACHALGIDLAVVVRQLTDAELEDLILTENLQREDPDPESEADLVARRLAEGASASEIAARYGKPELWVRRRAKLLGVIPAIRKLFTPGEGLDHFSIEMRERIGALDADLQKALATPLWKLRNADSMERLADIIRRETADLKGCKKWLNDPDTFVKGCGPGCASSSSDDLFSDGCSGRCTKPDCFLKRLALHTDKQILRALGDRDPNKVVFYNSEGYHDEFTFQGKKIKVVTRYEFANLYSVSEKPADIYGIDLRNPNTPKLSFLRRKGGQKNAAGSKNASPEEAREDKLKAKRMVILHGRLLAALQATPFSNIGTPQLLALLARFGTAHNRANGALSDPEDWDTEDKFPPLDIRSNEEPKDRYQVLWDSLKLVLEHRLTFFKNSDLLKPRSQKEMKHLANLVKFDWEKNYREACEEAPVPKSWGPGYDPVTLVKAGTKSTATTATVPGSGKTKLAKSAKKKTAKKTAKPAKKAPSKK